jgi:hypothetical protein
VIARRRRLEVAGLWVAGLAIGGGFWYLRNLLAVGNPLPGSLSFLPSPQFVDPWGKLSSQLFAGDLGPHYFSSALRFALGPLWPVPVLLAAIGIVLAVRRSPIDRVVAAAAVINVVSYAFAPLSGGSALEVNIRFFAITFAIGLCLLATDPLVAPRRWARLGLAAVLLVYVVESVHHYGVGLHSSRSVVAVVIAIAGAAAVLWRERLPRPSVRATTIGVVALAVIALPTAGYAITRHYLNDRYRYGPSAVSGEGVRQDAIDRVFARFQPISGARVGIAGIKLQFPLYGSRLSNVVQPVGIPLPHGALAEPRTCAAWRTAVNAGDFRYLVIAPAAGAPLRAPQSALWLRADPAVRLVYAPGAGVNVLRVTGRLNPATCS